MFEAILEEEKPENLIPLKLSIGTINTTSNLRLDPKNKLLYKLYKSSIPLTVASDLEDLKKQGLPYAVFQEKFIIDKKCRVIGDVQPYIENATTLTEAGKFHQETRDIDKRIPKMYQLIRFTNALNEKGFTHNDLHSDNFLVDDERIYAIDLNRLKRGKDVSEHQKHLNEILISYLFGLTLTETKDLLKTSSYILKEKLFFAPKFLNYLFSNAEAKEGVLDELVGHEKEAREIHRIGKR